MTEDATEVLTRFDPWLQKVARSILSPSHPNLEDLVQEGRVALWKALGTFNGERSHLTHWVTYRARNRMLEVATGKCWTGQPPRFHGRQGIQEPVHVLSLDASPGHENSESLAAFVPPPRDVRDDIETAEMAYHENEIREAIASLTPQQRKYVLARFWEDMTTAEMISEVFGYDPSALWNSKTNGAKYKLREALSHLADMS